MSKRRQRIKKRAARLGISYRQAREMYPRQKPLPVHGPETYAEYCARIEEERDEMEHEAYLLRETEKILAEDEIRYNAIIARRNLEDRELRSRELQKANIPQEVIGNF